MHKPETTFIITADSSLIYNLRADGYRRGQPIMVNEVQISLGCMHKKELREEIAKLIIDKLNDHYADELRVIAESNPPITAPPSGGPVNLVVGADQLTKSTKSNP